jgi:hypothetical protein
MGYYDYQQGLIIRQLKQKSRWDEHLEKCRSFILKAIEIENPSVITVLGSGWLVELPVAEIADKAKEIYLIDIVHPPEVAEQTKSLKGIRLLEKDISGGLIEEVWNKAGGRHFFNKLPSIGMIRIPDFEFDFDPGLLISLNILTQIEVLPEKLLRKKSSATEDQYLKFRSEVQEKHLRLLKKHKSLLISDSSDIILNNDGTTSERKTILGELPEGRLSEEWTWDFDLNNTDYNRKRSRFTVTARLF